MIARPAQYGPGYLAEVLQHANQPHASAKVFRADAI